MNNLLRYILPVVLIVMLANCSDNEVTVDPTKDLIKLNEGYVLGAGARIELWAQENFFTGYNKTVAVLYDSVTNKRITDAHIHYYPEMSMSSGMKHACPVEDPEEEPVNEGWPGALMFIMPSSDMGSWKMEVDVHNHLTNKEGSTTFDISVASPTVARIKSFVTDQSEKIFVAYYFPEGMKVGINPFEVIVYQMVAPYEFSPIEDYTIALTPEMPSMGHGSPNNVDPTYTSNDHYSGKVNFTMTGDWRLNLVLSKSGTTLKELYFDVTLE